MSSFQNNEISDQKIRLMQITHDLAIGGLQQVVVNICRTIDRNRFDVSVLCLRSLGEFAPEVQRMGIEVLQLPQKDRGTDYLSFLKVAKILKEKRIDVIHTHNSQPMIDGTLGALLTGVKTIVHTDHSRKFPDKRRYMIAEWVMSHFANNVVGVSEHTSQDLIRYEHISPRRVMTILNGIDGRKFQIKIDKEKKKKELGITRQGPVIGLGVRLSIQKGIIYLLKAMPELIRHYPDITLVIAGEGDQKEALKKAAVELKVDSNTLFIGPRMDMAEILKVLDLFVLPSVWEGLPMVLLEAMASECPIVATNVGGNHMVISNGENGLLVEPAEPGALSTAIIRILGDNEVRALYVKKGLEVFKHRLDAKVMTAKYEELYMGKSTNCRKCIAH